MLCAFMSIPGAANADAGRADFERDYGPQPPGMPPIAVGRFLQLYTVHHFLHGGRRQCPKTSDP